MEEALAQPRHTVRPSHSRGFDHETLEAVVELNTTHNGGAGMGVRRNP